MTWDPWLAETQISTALSTAAILHCRYPIAPWLSSVISEMETKRAVNSLTVERGPKNGGGK